jgi:hypothetical protein
LSRAATRFAHVIGLHKSGVPLQASIGTSMDDLEKITGPRSVSVNGRTFNVLGGRSLYIVRAAKLKEVSILPLGADRDTSVRIAAAERQNMTFEQWVASLGLSVATLADEQKTKLQAAYDTAHDAAHAAAPSTVTARETSRISAIHAAAGDYVDLADQAIREGWSEADTNTAVLTRMRATRPGVPSRGAAPMALQARPADTLSAAMMLHAGDPGTAEKAFGEKTAQQAADLQCRSMLDICAAALRLEGRDVPRGTGELIAASFTTLSLPIALSNLAEKTAGETFREQPAIWDKIARVRSVRNFKEAKIVRLWLTDTLQPLAPDGEIKHGGFGEGAHSVKLGTKAIMLVLTRVDIIDDDLGLFSGNSAAIGRAAGRTVNDDFAKVVMDNAAFFNADNGNYIEGSGSALSIDALQLGIMTMVKRTDAAGNVLDVRPRVLLVPPELELTARQIITSTNVDRYVSSNNDNRPTGNPLLNQLEVVVEPRLSSPAYTGNSATAWYLFSGPADGAVNIALLNGRRTPVIESSDADFNTLGVQFRGYHDYSFSLAEPLGALKSKGSA